MNEHERYLMKLEQLTGEVSPIYRHNYILYNRSDKVLFNHTYANSPEELGKSFGRRNILIHDETLSFNPNFDAVTLGGKLYRVRKLNDDEIKRFEEAAVKASLEYLVENKEEKITV